MKIIVVSDSHGDTAILREILKQFKDADLFIHCGDYCIPDYLMNDWRCVAGNCDWTEEIPRQLNIKTNVGLIHVEHGDSYQMMCNFKKYVGSIKAFIFLSGHTHNRRAEKIDNTYYFNPGSLTHPHDSSDGSFLVLNVDEKTHELTYDFYDVDLSNGSFKIADKIIKK